MTSRGASSLWLLSLLACGDAAPTTDAGPTPEVDAGRGDAAAPDAGRAGPVVAHCALDPSCPEVTIEGDAPSALPFRGHGDPSLERDPTTGTLWMVYSYLDVVIEETGPPPVFDFGIRTHLARSDDDGRSFRFVRRINDWPREPHPGTSADGRFLHEVATLAREPDGGFQALWLSYFNPLGGEPVDDRFDFFFARTRAARAEDLGEDSAAWAAGAGTSAAISAVHSLHRELPELSDCAAFTEPALFAHDGDVYLAAGCVVIAGGTRRPERERLVLLREAAEGYEYVGALLDGDDAARLGAERLEQADLSIARDGSVLLIVTPIRPGEDPMHQGCVVYTVDDLRAARVRRDDAGAPVPRAILTADGNGLGPGLCTYDATSETGVLLVITTQDLASDPPSVVFSMRATGLHP